MLAADGRVMITLFGWLNAIAARCGWWQPGPM